MHHTVEEVKLKNGARGLLIDIPGATVMSFQFHFNAGNRYVANKEIYETAHIMEHMAFGANARFKSEHEFEAEFTKNGADHNAFTSDLSMIYEATCADFEWDRILELQRLSITQPRFNEGELAAEKSNVRSELTGYLNHHERVLWHRLQQIIGDDILTYRQRLTTIPNVSIRDIREHHKRTHTTDNMRFVIAGRMHGRRASILRELEAFDLPRGKELEAPKDELKGGTEPVVVRRKDASNITFGWTMLMPKVIDDEQLDALKNLNHILTGTMHSRIFGKARQRGLVYGVAALADVRPHDSSWDIEGQVNHESAKELFALMHDELRQVLDGKITEAELDAAKSYALGRHQMGAQTVTQISGFYAYRYFMTGHIKSYDEVPDRIRRVTRKRMVDIAREFIDTDTWAFAAVSSGDKAELADCSDVLKELFK